MRVAGVEGQVVFVVAGVARGRAGVGAGRGHRAGRRSAGPRVSALLNASFGNLPEVVILVLAIDAGLADIARASIIGSVIGNVLLILGLSLLLGGWRNGIQTFNERVAGDELVDARPGRRRAGHPDAVLRVEPDMQARADRSRAGRRSRC